MLKHISVSYTHLDVYKRQGDGAEIAMIELVDFNEVLKAKAGTAKAGTRRGRRKTGGDNTSAAVATAAAVVAAPIVIDEVASNEEE